jgi:tetratricopeptide (TPR) repeat protein
VHTKNQGWLIASVAACVLGMATKEVMVTAPVLVFLLDATAVTGSFRRAWVERWKFHSGLAATWILLGALMISSELNRRGVAIEGLAWYHYARLECVAVVKYLGLALWPTPLVFDYGPNLPQPSTGRVVMAGLLLITLLGASVWQLARCRVSGFLGCAFFILLAPTSSVVPVAGQPIAENRMYLPLAAVLGALVGGALAADRRAWIPFAAGILALGLLSRNRNEDFRSATTIWRDTVAKQPVNQRAWVYFSEALKMEGKVAEAVEVLRHRLRTGPPAPELENNVAVALYGQARIAEALEHFQNAIRLNPSYAEAYYNLGAVLYRTEQTEPALECFKKHLEFQPQSVEGQNFAGLCLIRFRRFAEAIPYFQRAVELDPTHPHARANLESARAQLR